MSVSTIIHFCYLSLLVLVGLSGNLFVLKRFLHSKALRPLNATQYLVALACSDIGYVLIIALQLAEIAGLPWKALPGFCKIYSAAGYIFSFLSGWYIVAFSSERCLVIYWPFRGRTLTKKFSTFVILSVTAAGIVCNFWPALLIELHEETNKTESGRWENFQCQETALSLHLYEFFMVWDTVLSFCIPALLLFLLNVAIVWKLYKRRQEVEGISGVAQIERSQVSTGRKSSQLSRAENTHLEIQTST